MNLSKEQRFGVFSSIIFLTLLIILLLFFGFSVPYPPPEEEGILINFGTSEVGTGQIEPRPASQPEEVIPTPVEESTPPPTSTTEQVEEVNTQDFEEAAAIEAKKKRKKQEEIDNKKREEEERIRQEEIERQKIEEEKQQQQEAKQRELNERAKNAFGGQNAAGDDTGEGEGKGEGNQGSPDGDINSNNRQGGSAGGNGISFTLNGRSSRSLPPPPKIHNTEGKVAVEVTVDQNGNVVSARPGVRGSTISDAALLKVAKEAAMKAKFNVKKDAPALQKGTITYFFGFE